MGLKCDTRKWTEYEGSAGYECKTESMTDPYQFVPMAIEMERMFLAGQSLEQSRKALYNADGLDDDGIAPMVYYDALDVADSLNRIEKRSDEIHAEQEAERLKAQQEAEVVKEETV